MRVSEISKRYGGVEAVRGVTLEIGRGEVHGLVGANGAGKSTLLKIVSGLVRQDDGTVEWAQDDAGRTDTSGRIGLVMQESQLCDSMTVAENISLGNIPRRVSGLRVVHKKAMRLAVTRLLESIGVDVSPDAPVSRLSLATRRMVEVAMAMARDPRLLILDEPTTALGPEGTEHLLSLARRVSQHGVSVIFVSHRLSEIAEVCDRVTVLRDGAAVGTLAGEEISVPRMVTMMSGEEVHEGEHHHSESSGDRQLEVSGLSGPRFHDVDFAVHSGECAVVTGLVGSGRSSLLRALAGLAPSRGRVAIAGAPVARRSTRALIRRGVRYLPEDRGDGLLSGMSVLDNLVLPLLSSGGGSRWSLLRHRAARRAARDLVQRFGITIADLDQPIHQLSGGNQQKVMLAACMAMSPRVLLIDEPTQGVDVSAKAEIHRMLLGLTDSGGTVLTVMSEPEECIEVGDRFLVMRNGELVGELGRGRASKGSLTRLAFGHADQANGDEPNGIGRVAPSGDS
ncbi:MAG: sugar ABC transporter ATP-binding protein [Actinomycetota bacterium]